MWQMVAMGAIFTFACLFFYISGKVSGFVQGAQTVTEYYRTKGALKDKSNIIGYNSWETIFQTFFEGKKKEQG